MVTQTPETATREQLNKVLTMLETFEGLETVQRFLRETCQSPLDHPGAVIIGEKVILFIIGSIADHEAWRELREISRDFFTAVGADLETQ